MSATVTCPRCEGTGRLAHFGHVHNGVCRRCHGSGRLAKTRITKVAVTVYDVVYDGKIGVPCGEDLARAQATLAALLDARVPAELVSREVTRTVRVPA